MSESIKVYVIEDSETDLFFVRNAIETSDTLLFSGNAYNGKSALDFLNQTDVLPDLILLDINMPVMDGLECLKSIRKSEVLKSIPVVMFSTSDNPEDINNSFTNFASGYILKPNTYDRYVSFVENLETYWSVLKLP